MKQSVLIFVLGLSLMMLVVFILLTNTFGSTYTLMAVYKQFNQREVNDTKATPLKDKVRILCWIMTSPNNLNLKAAPVQNTWARRCNVHLFMSSLADKRFPTIGLNVSEGREHLTAKTVKAFRYVYDHYFEAADWFMKADDDTYVIVENLRYFLSTKDKNSSIYYGQSFKSVVKQGFFSGGAGYILSKEALRRFGLRGNDSNICKQDGGEEDVNFGFCMERLGVKAGSSIDSLGRSRFHCFNPETHLQGNYPKWYYALDLNGAKKGKDGISNYAISFHYVPPQKMYEIDFFIYHLRPYGLQSEEMEHVNKTK